MSKHTPGPWVIKDDAGNENPDGSWVAEKGFAGFSVTLIGHKERRANAHLIAAAPEMLEALKLALRLCPDELAQSNIEAVLAKAEGK